MSGITPPKLLKVNLSSSSIESFWEEGDPAALWYGMPYRWSVTCEVSPAYNSSDEGTNLFTFTGEDITEGMWIATGLGGKANRIVEITSQDYGSLTAIVEDVDRFNTFSDAYQSGDGSLPPGPGYTFEVSEDGQPILMGVEPSFMSDTYQTDLISRFAYRNIFNKYIRVNQPGHTFEIGDIVRLDDEGGFEAAAADLRANAAIGIVNSVGIPSADWFTFRPLCQVVNDVSPPLDGFYGQLYYIDPANPGKLTSETPASNARPIYMRLDTPTRALLLDAGMFDFVNDPVRETETFEIIGEYDGQTVFVLPSDCVEVLSMSINGMEISYSLEVMSFDNVTKELTIIPEAIGYGVDSQDEVFFLYKK